MVGCVEGSLAAGDVGSGLRVVAFENEHRVEVGWAGQSLRARVGYGGYEPGTELLVRYPEYYEREDHGSERLLVQVWPEPMSEIEVVRWGTPAPSDVSGLGLRQFNRVATATDWRRQQMTLVADVKERGWELPGSVGVARSRFTGLYVDDDGVFWAYGVDGYSVLRELPAEMALEFVERSRSSGS